MRFIISSHGWVAALSLSLSLSLSDDCSRLAGIPFREKDDFIKFLKKILLFYHGHLLFTSLGIDRYTVGGARGQSKMMSVLLFIFFLSPMGAFVEKTTARDKAIIISIACNNIIKNDI